MKPRVLMFGLEFPPYNSGGLGVACLGLTRALAARGAEVLFVMPKKLDVKVPWATFFFAPDGPITTTAFNSTLTPYITSSRYARESGGIYAGNLFGEVARYAAFGEELGRKEQFDIIYAHDWLSFGAGLEAKRV